MPFAAYIHTLCTMDTVLLVDALVCVFFAVAAFFGLIVGFSGQAGRFASIVAAGIVLFRVYPLIRRFILPGTGFGEKAAAILLTLVVGFASGFAAMKLVHFLIRKPLGPVWDSILGSILGLAAMWFVLLCVCIAVEFVPSERLHTFVFERTKSGFFFKPFVAVATEKFRSGFDEFDE